MAGDERFFAGLRRFYEQSMFEKAGTEDFRRVMEDETGLNLERFFERWIYGFGVPTLKVSHAVEQDPDGTSSVVVRAAQQGLIYDLPITIAIELENGAVREAVLVLTAATGELRVPVEGRVRQVTIDSDSAALARFLR
jgi:aminopeptidase N